MLPSVSAAERFLILRKRLRILSARRSLFARRLHRRTRRAAALSVIYSDAGVFEEYLFLPSNPNLVLMDVGIIAASPVRLTVSGMGDAVATCFERARAAIDPARRPAAGGKRRRRCRLGIGKAVL